MNDPEANLVPFPKPYRNREDKGQFVHRFKIDGRPHTLFKLSQRKDAPWYCTFQSRGRRILRSLETATQAEATKRVFLLVRAARAEKWDALEDTKVRQDYARIHQVIEVYSQIAPLTIKERTVRNNVAMLGHVLEVATGSTAWRELSTSELSGRLVRQWKDRFSSLRLRGVPAAELEQARRRCWLTGNSMLGQARSVFAKGVRRLYVDRGLRLPDGLEEFVEEPGFKRLAPDYRPASDALVSSTFDQVEALREADPNAFKAFWLAVGCGLRKGEITRARWEWFVDRGGQRWLVTEELGKDGRPIEVPVLANAWRRLAPAATAAGPVLTGTKTEVSEAVFRRIGSWMDDLGWESAKKVHELRAWTGSKIAEQHGLEQASRFLRHKDLRTTQKFYTRYLRLKGVDLVLPGVQP
jgi:integrase